MLPMKHGLSWSARRPLLVYRSGRRRFTHSPIIHNSRLEVALTDTDTLLDKMETAVMSVTLAGTCALPLADNASGQRAIIQGPHWQPAFSQVWSALWTHNTSQILRGTELFPTSS